MAAGGYAVKLEQPLALARALPVRGEPRSLLYVPAEPLDPGDGAGGLKIDLSRLFGAPDAIDVAARERDEQLLLAGREAVGHTVGIPKRQEGGRQEPKDELDELIDELDDFDL